MTPGTLTEDSLLEARSNNFLAAYSLIREAHSLAWVDISTGLMSVLSLNKVEDFLAELARLTPSEVLIVEDVNGNVVDAIKESGATATQRGKSAFDSTSGEERLKTLFSVSSLDAFGGFSRSQVSALGALAEYLASKKYQGIRVDGTEIGQPGDIIYVPDSNQANKIIN